MTLCDLSFWLDDLFPEPIGVSLPVCIPLMIPLGWELEYWVIVCHRGWFLYVFFFLPHFSPPHCPHPVSARLLWFMIWCSGLLISLLFWSRLLAGAGGGGQRCFCIPGPQGFTILLPLPFGWLCFTSLEGLVREKLPASPKCKKISDDVLTEPGVRNFSCALFRGNFSSLSS